MEGEVEVVGAATVVLTITNAAVSVAEVAITDTTTADAAETATAYQQVSLPDSDKQGSDGAMVKLTEDEAHGGPNGRELAANKEKDEDMMQGADDEAHGGTQQKRTASKVGARVKTIRK